MKSRRFIRTTFAASAAARAFFAERDRLPELAQSLVDRHVSVIVAADVVSAHAAKAATSTIPIVFLSGI
jgi:putative ABC transport system substrate-binding protein